jgi:3-oxoacyl-[acyl-carrier protein] reductase
MDRIRVLMGNDATTNHRGIGTMDKRRFLITGGSQGIGAALVTAAREAGDEVVFTGRNAELISRVSAETGAHGVRADVSVSEDNARTVTECRRRMGGVDVLVNNAGFGYPAMIGEVDVERMKSLFDTNVFGLVDLTNRVVPMMKEQEQGDIVNIASTSGLKGHPGGTAYSASKWAVRGISQCWQAELRPHGIRVVCVCPSEVQTDWGGKTGRDNPNKLFAPDIAQAILSALGADRRALWPEFAVFATNPWKEA